ncbi:MAG TPA: hypothetical protein VNO30_00795 [Kofleriaceae bacterium]|nr:hypothetical protein [Kofleriaceae bacterium]
MIAVEITIVDAMGRPEQFAQRTFAEETKRVTRGAAQWEDPPEIRLEKVQSDGFIKTRQPHLLQHLPAPWPEAGPHAEVMVELKLAGNHLDRKEVTRAEIRRLARELQRIEKDASWRGIEPLWLVASHLPEWLDEFERPERFAPGCYCVEPRRRRFLWIAANELPLVDELVPFLMARSGQALEEFGRWVAPRRPLEWVLSMLEYLPMTTLAREELLWRFGKADDPEVEARRQHILKVLLEQSPETQQELIDKGRSEGQLVGELAQARAALRRVLVHRQLTPSQDEDARIDACTDLETLERWNERAFTATSATDALT